jgi:hypothetical protein
MPDDKFAELDKKVQFLADAAATRHNLEHARKSVIAMAMKAAENRGHKHGVAQEREAYASTEYGEWLAGSTEAVRNHEKARLEWEVLKIRFEYWRSKEATRREEMKLT